MEKIVTNVGFHFLYPSHLFAHRAAHEVQTILGSCIAVCLYDTRLQFGGINHFMMPLWNGQGLASPKYGNIAIENLIQEMVGLGSYKKDLAAKVFGGASQLNLNHELLQVGQRNILIADSLLKKNGIPVLANSTGGKLGRKITFNTRTGQVIMNYLVKQHAVEKKSF